MPALREDGLERTRESPRVASTLAFPGMLGVVRIRRSRKLGGKPSWGHRVRPRGIPVCLRGLSAQRPRGAGAVGAARDGRSREGLPDLRRGARRSWWVCVVLVLGLPLGPGCATMRRNAPIARPAPVHRRLRLHRRRLAAGHPAHPPRPPRPGQAAGRPLPRPGAQRHLLDDHRRPPPRPARRAGATRSSSSTSAARASSRRVGLGRRGQRAAPRRRPCWRSARGAGPSTTMARYDVPAILDYVKAATGQRPGQLGRPQPGRDADVPLPGAVARARRGSPTSSAMGATIILADDAPDATCSAPTAASGCSWRGRQHRAARPAADVRPVPGPRPDRPVLLHRRRTSTGGPISRFYGYTLEDPGRSALAAARPLPGVRPLRLGRPHGSTTRPGSAEVTHADPDDRRRGRLHVRRPLDRS